MEDVMKVFVVHVYATLPNGCDIHASIIRTNTRWKITKCDVINFLVRINFGQEHDNSFKSKVRKDVDLGNNFSYIPCTLPLIVVIFGG